MISRSTGLIASALLGALSPSLAPAAAPQPLAPRCASGPEAALVRAAFAKPAPPAPFAAAQQLELPEAVVVSALPAEQAYGVAASHFQAIWESLQAWESSVFVVMKGGHVFEVYGKLFHGEPSKRSNFFNLHGEGAGMSGHLRPDLLSAIYVISIPGKEAPMRGVLFYDQAGEAAFGVYVPGEGSTPSESLIKAFEATAAEIRSLPAVCERSD
jgi:putative heme utilization carrier protein HutX